MTRSRAVAFAPGRVNLIGEHTDYNDGLALPFAIEDGVTVTATALDVAAETGADARGGGAATVSGGIGADERDSAATGAGEIVAEALDFGETDRFPVDAPERVDGGGWRAFVRGVVAELGAAGFPIRPARLEIHGTVPQGSGLSSSAALSVSLALALLALAGEDDVDRRALARLCSRVENTWVGAQTGLLDQLASLFGEADRALRIDFRSLAVDPAPLVLGGWQLVTVDSHESHDLSASGYNERRAECARAAEALGVDSLRDAPLDAYARLPDPLDRRARHVLSENARVQAAVRTLHDRDFRRLGRLLDASHASLRDDYDSSTPAVERTVNDLKAAGAAGARMVGGGFGGHVLALIPPGTAIPPGARVVTPSAGARVDATRDV